MHVLQLFKGIINVLVSIVVSFVDNHIVHEMQIFPLSYIGYLLELYAKIETIIKPVFGR